VSHPQPTPAICGICKNIVVYGRKTKAGRFHAECLRMQNRGLLSTPDPRPAKDSTGQSCRGCNSIIDVGDQHAHRAGKPYHRECLL
jgi:hypothetical protein